MSTQCKCILLFGNNMKHFNVLKWHVNLILKHCLAFKCLIIKRNYKGHGMTTKKVLLFETTHSFYGWPKTMIKTWNKIFHSTIVLFHITFKSKCETNDKSCFSARAGKVLHNKSSRENGKCHPYLLDFLQTFPSCWYHKN